jgi:RNA polymerase sigma factor (sigma-70 family)
MAGEALPTVLRHLLAQVSPPEGIADGVLLQRFVAHGDEAAFEALVRRHGPRVLDVCLGVLHNSHDADDVFQATFLVLARKANSIRKQDSLGSFLYGVAQRIARKVRTRAARRREREQQAADMPTPQTSDELDRQELRALLCAELEHVAEEYRSALVLFYLEGKSYSETARALRCPVGTVRSRLARGREALRQRLLGRDGPRATPSGVAVPAGLLAATMKAAVRGGASPQVLALAEEALRGLALDKAKSVLAVLLAVGALAVATGLLAGPHSPGEKVAVTGSPRRAVPDPAPAANPNPPRLDVTGRALDRAGAPVVGATVYLRECTPWRGLSLDDVLAMTKTDAQGAFTFRGVVGKPLPSAWEADQHPWEVVVVAPGRAVVWRHLTPEVRRRGLEIRLGPGKRLTGRVMAPGGQPVGGAEVRVIELIPPGSRTTSPVLYPWGMTPWRKDALVLQGSRLPLTARTDARGRFVLNTLPAGMLVRLGFSSGDYLGRAVWTATTAEPQPNLIGETISNGKKYVHVEPVLSGDWTVTLQPGRRLRGRVLEAGTDGPVPGARVTAFTETVTTDAQGRFTLAPLPSNSRFLCASGPPGADYLPVGQEFHWPQRGEPEVTLQLRRGIAVTGQVVDEDTGRGIATVDLRYQCSHGSPGAACSFPARVLTDSGGRFRLVVPAGPGKLTAHGIWAGYHDPQTHTVDAQPSHPSVPLTFTLRRGIAIRGRVLGPDGRGIRAAELKLEEQAEPAFPRWRCVSGNKGKFHLEGLPPGLACEWVVIHPGLRLGARLPQALPPGRNDPLRVDIRLEPLGTLTGRILDPHRSPLSGATVRILAVIHLLGRGERETEVGGLAADRAGRFRFDRVLPGPRHRFRVEVTAAGHVGLRSAAFEVRPGGTRVVPDLVLPTFGPALDGTVLGPTGRPLADVRLRVHFRPPALDTSLIEPSPVVTGTDGRFRLSGLPSGPLELEAEQCLPGAHDPGRPAGPTAKIRVEPGRKAPVVLRMAGRN